MLKKSKQREAIINVLRNTTSHPTAELIYQEVKKVIPEIGIATVYRNLRILKSSGDILEIRTSRDTAHYDGNTASHCHFTCEKCNCVIDIEGPMDRSIEKKLAQKTGLFITKHDLVFTGLCLKCQQSDPRSG